METPIQRRPREPGRWRHRDFLKLRAGQSISFFANRIGGFAQTFVAILLLHASPIEVAIINEVSIAFYRYTRSHDTSQMVERAADATGHRTPPTVWRR